MNLHIEGRRWFQCGPGNTYHSVRIFIAANAEYGTRYLREELGGTYSVIDVNRKADL